VSRPKPQFKVGDLVRIKAWPPDSEILQVVDIKWSKKEQSYACYVMDKEGKVWPATPLEFHLKLVDSFQPEPITWWESISE